MNITYFQELEGLTVSVCIAFATEKILVETLFSHDVQNDTEAHLASILTYTLTRTAGAWNLYPTSLSRFAWVLGKVTNVCSSYT